jgi:Thiolase, N-terminal domain
MRARHKRATPGFVYSLASSMPIAQELVCPLLQDPKTGEEHDVVISKDDGVRPGTTAASLGKLRAVFKKDGTTTAGNSSQVRTSGHLLMLSDSIVASRCRQHPTVHGGACGLHADVCTPLSRLLLSFPRAKHALTLLSAS